MELSAPGMRPSTSHARTHRTVLIPRDIMSSPPQKDLLRTTLYRHPNQQVMTIGRTFMRSAAMPDADAYHGTRPNTAAVHSQWLPHKPRLVSETQPVSSSDRPRFHINTSNAIHNIQHLQHSLNKSHSADASEGTTPSVDGHVRSASLDEQANNDWQTSYAAANQQQHLKRYKLNVLSMPSPAAGRFHHTDALLHDSFDNGRGVRSSWDGRAYAALYFRFYKPLGGRLQH